MYLIRQLQTWLFFLLIIRALVVQRVQYRELNFTELSLLPSQSTSIDRLNQTSPSPDPDISANKPAVFCDATEYGRDLVTADCRDAITGIKRNKQRVRFGERSADPETWDVGLPSRQIGGKDAAEENPPVSLLCYLTSKQYRDFARFNWNSSLAGHPLLLPHLMYPKPPSPY